MRMIFVAAALAMTSHVAMANDLPRYDVEGYCSSMVENNRGGDPLFNGCIKDQEQAYHSLQSNWDDVPENLRHSCMELVRLSEAAYSLLGSCVGDDRRGSGSRQTFSF